MLTKNAIKNHQWLSSFVMIWAMAISIIVACLVIRQKTIDPDIQANFAPAIINGGRVQSLKNGDSLAIGTGGVSAGSISTTGLADFTALSVETQTNLAGSTILEQSTGGGPDLIFDAHATTSGNGEVDIFSGGTSAIVFNGNDGGVVTNPGTGGFQFRGGGASAPLWGSITGVQYMFVDEQVLTSGTTWTPSSGVRELEITECGGGGGGGGSPSGSGRGAGAGGASGAILHFRLAASSFTGGSITIGAAGAAGSSAGGAGGNGGDTSISISSTTYTAKGGGGGAAGVNNTVVVTYGGIPQSGSTSVTGGTIGGFNGENGGTFTATSGAPGNGAGSPWGIGGQAAQTLGPGNNGTGNCSGGGAGYSSASGEAGGSGTIGLIIVDEYR